MAGAYKSSKRGSVFDLSGKQGNTKSLALHIYAYVTQSHVKLHWNLKAILIPTSTHGYTPSMSHITFGRHAGIRLRKCSVCLRFIVVASIPGTLHGRIWNYQNCTVIMGGVDLRLRVSVPMIIEQGSIKSDSP